MDIACLHIPEVFPLVNDVNSQEGALLRYIGKGSLQYRVLKCLLHLSKFSNKIYLNRFFATARYEYGELL